MRYFAALLAGFMIGMISGCAGLDMHTISNNEADESEHGFRYYDTSPFLLVYSDNKGGLTSKLLYLPDMAKKRSIKPYNYLASNNTTLKFEDGRLTSAKAVVDETVIPTAILTSLEKIATSSIKAANAGKNEIPGPYLFRIVKKDTKWVLAGGQALNTGGEPATIRYLPN
jgi:hypothetical protein